jgi:hypothetical protein
MGENRRQFFPHGGPGLARGTTASQDHEVIAHKALLLLAKSLAHEPFDAIAIDCPRRGFSANDDADAGPGQGIRPHENTEMTAARRRPAR